MLQGTLDVFSLDEVLGLLSGAKKSGVLNITGDRGVGAIAIADGLLVAGSASSAPDADGLADAIFELLRFEDGSFSFDGDAVAEGDPADLETVLTEAHARLGEWREIEAVVPTLDHHLALAESLSTSQVTLDESEWAAIVAIGEGATVGVVAHRLDLGEFDGSKRVMGLIERSLATISAAAPAAPVDLPVSASPVDTPVEEIVEAPPSEIPAFEPPQFETPAPAPANLEVSAPAPAAFASEPAEAAVADVIPPMPDAPQTDEMHSTDVDVDIPPMPEPPGHFDDEAAIAGEFAAPIEAESFEPMTPTVDDPPSSFGGFDPIDSVDMFEPPRRNTEGDADGFLIADDAPAADTRAAEHAVESALESEVATEVPSLAPPAFDPDAFAVNNDDEGADVTADPFSAEPPSDRVPEADDPSAVGDETADDVADDSADHAQDDTESDKGGSLLMRYLKSHG